MMPSPDLEKRFARIEGFLEQMSQRFSHLENRLEAAIAQMREDFRALSDRVDRLEDRVYRLEDRVDRYFLWTMGVMLTSWLTIIVAIVLRG